MSETIFNGFKEYTHMIKSFYLLRTVGMCFTIQNNITCIFQQNQYHIGFYESKYTVTFLLKLFFSPAIKLHVIFMKIDQLMVILNQQNEHVKIIHKHRNMNSSKSFLH